jgi:hypothetical protein
MREAQAAQADEQRRAHQEQLERLAAARERLKAEQERDTQWRRRVLQVCSSLQWWCVVWCSLACDHVACDHDNDRVCMIIIDALAPQSK